MQLESNEIAQIVEALRHAVRRRLARHSQSIRNGRAIV